METRSIRPARQLPARTAYDAFAALYDNWKWQRFWHINEWPHIDRLIASVSNDPSILDVGAGTGYYLAKLQMRSHFLCGVDISLRMLKRARTRLNHGVHLLQADAVALPFSSGSFHVVVINRVASHIADLERLSAELERVLRNGGRLIISDVAAEHDYPATEFKTPMGVISAETYKHSIEDWRRTNSLRRLRVHFSTLISASNAAWLPLSFGSIDRSGQRPIGFVLALDKN